MSKFFFIIVFSGGSKFKMSKAESLWERALPGPNLGGPPEFSKIRILVTLVSEEFQVFFAQYHSIWFCWFVFFSKKIKDKLTGNF